MKGFAVHVWSGDNNLFSQHSTLAMLWPHCELDQLVSLVIAPNIKLKTYSTD